MSMCIQHCWLYGSIMRGSRNFCQGEGGGGPKKTLITFFKHQLFYRFTEGNQWFILRKTIFLRFQRGSNILQGRGSKFFQGVGANVNIEFVNFQGWGSGPLDPRMRMIDPLAFTVKPIPKDRFSHAMAHFSLLERLVTLQNMIRYMILDILSGSTVYIRTGTLYEISMR